MDCRTGLGLALCLLGGAVGCQHQVATLPPSGAMSLANQPAPPDPSKIKKASDVPAKEPPAAVLVSWGDFKAGEAFAPSIPPDRQQQIRDEARREYQRALARDPKYVPAYQGLARLYTAMHDQMHAVETYHKALQIAPRNTALWYELGRSHTAAREFGPALECLNRAVQLEPDNRDCLNTLGIVLAETGRVDESLGCFVRASGEAMGHYRLARTLQHLNQPELSQQHLALALHKDPSLANAQVMRSQTLPGANPSIQRTAYQDVSVPHASFAPAAPNAPETPTAPTIRAATVPPTAPMTQATPDALAAPAAPVAEDSPLPQVINVGSSENRPAPQSILVPPPPAVNLNYDPPANP